MFSRRNKVIKVWKLHTRAIDYRIFIFGTIYLIHLILNYKVIVLNVMSGVTAKTHFFILVNNKKPWLDMFTVRIAKPFFTFLQV